MRIALVSEHASPLAVLGGEDAGGQNVHVDALARGLAARGHDVVVHTRRDNPDLPEFVELTKGVTVHHVDAGPAKPVPKDEFGPFLPQFAAELTKQWEKQRPDIVHAHFWMSGVVSAQGAEQFEIPSAITFHALGVVKKRHQADADTSPDTRIPAERQLLHDLADVAAKRFNGGLGLQELLFEAAIANGYTGRTFRDSRRVLEAAFGRGIEAGMTTIDVGGILSNVANKFLLEGFFSVERVWRSICAVRNVSDFKTVTSYRLVGKDQYEQVAPGGELKQGTLGEETYTNKADTYGLMLSIDRRDIINDDLGAITTVPRKLGRGSGLKINDVFWTAFMNNAAFFSAGNKNFVSGADTALGIDGLTKGEVAFMDLVDSDGKPTGVMPAILLVPTALSAMGTQLYKSVELRDTTANTKFPVANPHQGKFRIEVSRYLANAIYTGNSAKAWYLLADPNDLPVIEVAFLDGKEAPTVESSEADFNMLGIRMRGYHDFGVNLQDPRGGVKSKGEV